MEPYYDHNGVTIYHGDCREILPTLGPVDLVLTDPPYGIGYKRGVRGKYRPSDNGNAGIVGDCDTSARDDALAEIDAPGFVFGSFYAPFPARVRQVLVFLKPPGSGIIGCCGTFRRDVEPIFVIGELPGEKAYLSSVISSHEQLECRKPIATRTGHPHAKPLSVIATLLRTTTATLVLDPFMGSGTTLRAAKDLGRRAIGIEIEECYCEIAAKRLEQEVLAL